MPTHVKQLIVWLLAAPIFAPCLALGFPAESCTVTGRAVDSRTGQPVSRVDIEMAAVSSEEQPARQAEKPGNRSTPASEASKYSAMSDEKGGFRISSVRAGRYVLLGRKAGFLPSPYKAASPSQMSAIIVLKDGESAEVTLRMIPQGLIAGKVVDENGDPVDSGNVQVLSAMWLKGTLHYSVLKGVPVDDLGEFRIGGLGKGSYLVKFQPRETALNPNLGGPARRDHSSRLVPAYYPNATSVQSASAVVLGPGESVAGLDIVVRRARTYIVEGVLRTLERPPEFASVTLAPSGESVLALVAGPGVLGPGGKFRFPSVPAGDYELYFVAGLGQGVSTGRRPVRVTDGDVTGLEIDALPTVSLTGHVSVEGGDLDGAPEARIGLRAADLPIGPSYGATVGSDGVFELKSCSPGRYAVDVTPPDGFYVKKMRYGGIDVAGAEINVTGLDARLELVLRRGAARLRGRWPASVNDNSSSSGGDRVTLGAYYFVIPQDREISESDLRFGPLAEDGGFDAGGLPPGRYRVFALTSPSPGLLMQPATLAALEGLGAQVTLGEGEAVEVVVPLLADDKAESLFNSQR